jgi:hypothetical protein
VKGLLAKELVLYVLAKVQTIIGGLAVRILLLIAPFLALFVVPLRILVIGLEVPNAGGSCQGNAFALEQMKLLALTFAQMEDAVLTNNYKIL